MLKRAAQHSLTRPVESCRRPPFLPDELGAVRPPDQQLGMPEISTDGEVNNGKRQAIRVDVRGAKLICLLSARPTGR